MSCGHELSGLDRVPWERLHHAYGPATDVPAQLRALRSQDPGTRAQALGQLFGNVYHQGTRWQASAYAVPFLVGLIDDPHVPGRGAILDLLTAIAIGDLRDDALPFDPAQAFAAGGDALTEEQLDEVVRRVYDDDDDPFSDAELSDLADRAVFQWAAGAYEAAAHHVDRYRCWLDDPDADVAATSAALLAWFTPTDGTLAALLAVPGDRVEVRASANLTLAHAADGRVDVDQHLGRLVEDGGDLVALTAAVALAYRTGQALSEPALDCLIDADAVALPDQIPGWDRAPLGFVALARQRLGL
ncbi:hypothetical protein GCM10023322_25470 [Rugosimonospora acidiphila]|uniref:HEAT repeat-containing protein n=1 Tax=Rugosimonospora acidiphila TaxID=556531 RepID=A0ABP9RQX7_9ACTN